MSWLVSSIANSLKLDDDGHDFDPETTTSASSTTATAGKHHPSAAPKPNADDDDDEESSSSSPADQAAHPRGVKGDLSELSQTLTRQFWGVASFLAPPPQISDRDRQYDNFEANSGDPAGISGIRNDLSEIGGKFRTGISKLSENKAVSEFTKIASNFLQFGMEDKLTMEDYARQGVVGVTEEVVAFARDIALHPETWLDFPLPDDDDEEEDFELSDAQQEHALAVERLVPELAALRSEICLGYMSEASFWKIYFVLVHPRLSKHDALILSTPEIVKARAMLSQELRSCGRSMPHEPRSNDASADAAQPSHEEQLSVPVIDRSDSIPVEISTVEQPVSSMEADLGMDKHPVTCTEIPVVEKTVIEEFSIKPTAMEGVSTKHTDIEEVPTKPTNVDKVSTNSTSVAKASTNQTNSNEASTKQTNVDEVSIKQTKFDEVAAKPPNVEKPTTTSSKFIDPKDEDDADDWLREEHAEAAASKGTSYPLGNDDDISFSDLEED